MKVNRLNANAAAFSFVDLLIVLVIVLLLAMLVPPYLVRSGRSPRIACISNLKQIGLGYRLWANDHDGKFPMSLSTNQGGTMEWNEHGQIFRHYQAMSDVLGSPKLLSCPSDTKRIRTTNWERGFGNQNLSYFVGLNADESNPQMILSGDRNITGGILTNKNVMVLDASNPAGWTKEIHKTGGNIGLADGSAIQVTEESYATNFATTTTGYVRQTLRNQLLKITDGPTRIAIP